MPIQSINGKLYIEPSDMEGLKDGTLKSHLYRARKNKDNTSLWYNIANPHFNGKNSRRIILVDTLPKEYKQKVLEKFNTAIQELKKDVQIGLTKTGDRSSTTNMMIEATSKTISIGEKFVKEDIKEHIEKEWKSYSGHYVELGCSGQKIIAYARTCALIEKIWQTLDYSLKDKSLNEKEIKRLKLSLLANVQNVLGANNLNVQIPKSCKRLSYWLQNIIVSWSEEKEVYDIVLPKNLNNTNRGELSPEQQKVADRLRSEGNAKPIQTIYDELINIGKHRGWWTKANIFTPPHYSTLARYFTSVDNLLAYGREGYISSSNNYQPSIKRTLPSKKNALFVIDASPIDILVYMNGKARQQMNSFRVFEVASNKAIGFTCWKGPGEPAHKAIEAIKEAIRNTGYLPKYIQGDAGPASTQIQLWCEQNNIEWMHSQKGKSRNKYAEQLIGRFGKVLRKHPAWSGQNRTALGRNSQTSDEQKKIAGSYAMSFEHLEHWVRTEAIPFWNNSIIKELGMKKCDKTPNQLWEELESYTTKLSEIDTALLGGYHHRVKLTIDGLTVQNNKEEYTYFPDISNEKGFKKGLEIFAQTPRKHHPQTSKLTLYLTEYGKQAFIFNKDIEKGGKYLDTWNIKPTISMTAHLDGDTKKLNMLLKFQQAWKELSKKKIEQANLAGLQNGIEPNPQFMTQNKNKVEVETQYNKAHLHQEEFNDDKAIALKVIKETEEIVEKIHPFTGEVIKISKKSLNDA